MERETIFKNTRVEVSEKFSIISRAISYMIGLGLAALVFYGTVRLLEGGRSTNKELLIDTIFFVIGFTIATMIIEIYSYRKIVKLAKLFMYDVVNMCTEINEDEIKNNINSCDSFIKLQRYASVHDKNINILFLGDGQDIQINIDGNEEDEKTN